MHAPSHDICIRFHCIMSLLYKLLILCWLWLLCALRFADKYLGLFMLHISYYYLLIGNSIEENKNIYKFSVLLKDTWIAIVFQCLRFQRAPAYCFRIYFLFYSDIYLISRFFTGRGFCRDYDSYLAYLEFTLFTLCSCL